MKSRFGVTEANATKEFYERLAAGTERRSLWGIERRFDAVGIPGKRSVADFFLPKIKQYINPVHRVVDIGCGPGGFLLAVAPHCAELTGIDLSDAFVEEANKNIKNRGLSHCRALVGSAYQLPLPSGSVDRAIMIDSLHHMDDPARAVAEAYRVLKPGGFLLLFEPNKLNPLLALMCALDRNEWGLLMLGSQRAYRNLLNPVFDIVECRYNGLLIGPSSRAALWIARMLCSPYIAPYLGWLCPKIFISARKRED